MAVEDVLGNEKVCTKCGSSKPLSEFYDSGLRNNRTRVRNGLWKFSKCKACCVDATRISRQKNPSLWRGYRRGIDLKYRYGISLDLYDAMFEKQGGRCKLCSAKPRNRRLAVDHDHATGKVRGLLCVKCNTGLGKIQDNIAAVLAYLTPEYGMSGC